MRIACGRIAAIRVRAPRGARTISVRGCYVAPGFIDLHVWGDPETVLCEAVKGGTTAFLTTLGPEPPEQLRADVAARSIQGTHTLLTTDRRGATCQSKELRMCPRNTVGAECLGVHLEGPFLNPRRQGALPGRWMRRPSANEFSRLARGGRVRLVTIAPELPGAASAIRWCARHRITASLGHSDADETAARRAVEAGATAVTHVFNGMRPFHHRSPSLLDVALTDPRLTAMVICDGVHVSPSAFRLLVRAKGAGRVALVTDSVRFQRWDVVKRHGAYYTKRGVLAGSALTMIDAVRNAVRLGGASLEEAVRMATETPARLIGERSRGTLAAGQRADLVVFDRQLRVQRTIVGGRTVYQRI